MSGIRKNAERDDKIIALRAEGMTFEAIGKRLGISKNVAIGVVSRFGRELVVEEKPIRTFDDRINAPHAKLDAVLAECADRPSFHEKTPTVAAAV